MCSCPAEATASGDSRADEILLEGVMPWCEPLLLISLTPLTADAVAPLACRRYGAILSLPVSLLLGWLVTEIVEKPLGKRMRFKEPATAP